MVENVLIESSVQLVSEVGKIGILLQTLGIVVILWLIFEIVAFFINRKRLAEVYKIKKDMIRIESKIDKLIKRK